MTRASDIESEEPPRCPSCKKTMTYYGGSTGFICCQYKLLFRGGGWFDAKGKHVKDDRLAGGDRRVDGVVAQFN